MQLQRPQKYLHLGGMIAFIVLLNTVCPLSTDMYMPSLPTIATEFGVSATEVNSTLYMYFLFLALGIVLLGPVSDKYGRKKILIASCSLYTISAFVCFMAPTLTLMIVARCFQGLAAGGMLAVMTAVIKDSFEGRSRSIVLSLAQALGTFAPILAPLLGAAVVQFVSWHYVFLILTGIGIIMTSLSVLFQETIPEEEKITESIFHSYAGLPKVLKNKSFTIILLCVAFFVAPFMAYLGNASYIYQDMFGCTTVEFSMFFASAALVSAIGSVSPIYFSKNLNAKRLKVIITTVITMGILGTVLVVTIGKNGALVFFISFVTYMISMSFMRPFLTDIILRQHRGDTGSAASVLNFIINVISSAGMIIGSLPWPNFIFGLGITMIIFVTLALITWIYVLTAKSFELKVNEIE